MCCYINVVIHWWCDFVQQWDGKRSTHEWLLNEDAYYVHHILSNEDFNNEHQQEDLYYVIIYNLKISKMSTEKSIIPVSTIDNSIRR